MTQETTEHEGSEEPFLARLVSRAPFVYVAVAINLLIVFVLAHLANLRLTPSFHDQQRLLQVVLLVLIGVLVVTGPIRDGVRRGFADLPPAARLGLAFVVMLGALSSARAAQPQAAFREVGLFVLLGILALLVADGRRVSGEGFADGVLRLAVVASGTYAVVFTVFAVTVDRTTEMFGFSHPRFLGQVALWLVPLLVAAVAEPQNRRDLRLGRWVIAVAWWALLLESGSRAALLGSLLGSAVIWLLGRKAARRWLRAYLLIAGTGTAVWFAWTRLLGRGAGGLDRVIEEAGDDRGRLSIWTEALELAFGRPLLGVGPEHYAYHAIRPEGHPHSAPVQYLAEWGAPATLVIAALACWGVLAWLRGYRRQASGTQEPHPGLRDRPEITAALTAALIAGAFASLVDGVLVMPVSQMVMVGVVGWALGSHLGERADPATRWRVGGGLTVVAGLTAAAVLLAGAWGYATQPVRELTSYAEEHPDKPLTPRFWQVGRLDR